MKYNHGYMADYLKNILPVTIKRDNFIDPYYVSLFSEEIIKDSVDSFVYNMHKIYDYVIENKDYYDQFLKKPNAKTHLSLANSFPILHCLKSVLFNIGFFGKIIDSGTKIQVDSLEQLVTLVNNQGVHLRKKATESRFFEVLLMLKKCGLSSDSIAFENKKVKLLSNKDLIFEYKKDPNFLRGIKLLAIAERKESQKGKHNIFLRCDYDVISSSNQDIEESFKDFISPLSEVQKNYLINLHNTMLSIGMTCKYDVFYLNVRLMYYIGSREVWTLSKSIESGYRLLIKTKKNSRYLELMNHFPKDLLTKIQKGFGCSKKYFGEATCQMGCHGYSFEVNDALDETISYIEEWLRLEKEYSGRKTKRKA